MVTEQSILAVIRAGRPSFRNRHDKAAFALHAAFLSAGYVLNATGSAAFSDDALSSSSADEVGMDTWNEVEDSYAFIYSNPQRGSKKVLVKCISIDDKLLVDAVEDDDGSEPVYLEINMWKRMGGRIIVHSTRIWANYQQMLTIEFWVNWMVLLLQAHLPNSQVLVKT